MQMKNTTIKIIGIVIFLFGKSLYAEHSCDAVSSSPTSNIATSSEVVTISNIKTTGVGIEVTLTANPVDKDTHKDSPNDPGTEVDDTFNNTGAIEWSSTLGGTFDKTNEKVVKWTSPNNPAQGDIILKLKDDGTHKQDFTVLTEVKRITIKVVNPNGSRIASQVPSFDAHTRYMATPVIIQVTYQGQDLPWIGHLAEKYKGSSSFYNVLNLPYVYNANGQEFFPNWNTAGDYAIATSKQGRLTDNHTNPNLPVIAGGQYVDLGGQHQVAYVDGGNKTSLQVFKDKEYLKRDAGATSDTPIHDEAP